MLSYGNNFLGSCQPQAFHLLHLDALHRQPFSPSLVTLPSHPSTLILHLRLPSLNVIIPTLSDAIARQFSSPAEPTGFKLIHILIRHRLLLQPMRSSLRRLHMNSCQILGVYYSDKNLVSFLIHIGPETELYSQLSKFNITIRGDFDPLDPLIIRDTTLVNEIMDCKLQGANKAFLHRICAALQRFRTPICNAIASFFVQPGLINFASPYKHHIEHVLGHVYLP